jgi:dTDP-4-amino-4,6-dideoxygalactose transaminase
MLVRLQQVQAVAKRNAATLLAELGAVNGLSWPEIPPGAEPAFLRLPVVVANTARTNRLFAALHGAGIGVSRSYQRSLPDLYAGLLPTRIEDFPGARKLARDLLTLPVHPGVGAADLARMVKICRGSE